MCLPVVEMGKEEEEAANFFPRHLLPTNAQGFRREMESLAFLSPSFSLCMCVCNLGLVGRER